ncbi:MAG: hydroxyethylthiazole kinase [Hydrogenibacillus sp.]|nr:hydroxyethylthiazole kinase [Hydrogenibacillus sp.]
MIKRIRAESPLIHCITNTVVQNFTANGLLSLGASPVMSDAPEEAGEMARLAKGLLINIGTLHDETIRAMEAALRSANEAGVPAVLDPVGVGSTTFRTKAVQRLLTLGRFTVIRGNVAEVANTIGRSLPIKGVDGGTVSRDIAVDVARQAARALGAVVAATGPEDVVTDGERTIIVQNGDPLMSRVTGVGCLLGAVVAAFLSVEGDPFRAAAGALIAYGIAGEMARETLSQRPESGAAVLSGAYGIAFLDALDALHDGAIDRRARWTVPGEMTSFNI